MAKVFVSTHIEDAHAIAVQVALERHGHKVARWLGADCPTTQTHTVTFGDNSRLQVKSPQGSFFADEFDIIWWRRQTPVYLPENLHKGDAIIATREWDTLYASMWTHFNEDAVWINSWHSQKLADSKILQLRLARNLGFRTPNTLISNDVQEIRAFVSSQPNGAVHKMFKSAFWENDEKVARARTTKIHLSDLANEASLRLCPGIFQEKIENKYEIRATFFGDKDISVSIRIDERDDGICDWRSVDAFNRRLVQIELPDFVRRKCISLLKKLGLEFGCFDMVVTPEDDYVFLEVNEMGQFLWVEGTLPDVPMLSTFCNFLLSKDPHVSEGNQSVIDVSFHEIYESVEYKRHVASDHEYHVDKVPYLKVAY